MEEIEVRAWHPNNTMPPDITKYPLSQSEMAIDNAREQSRLVNRYHTVQVVTKSGYEIAKFAGTWIYNSRGISLVHNEEKRSY